MIKIKYHFYCVISEGKNALKKIKKKPLEKARNLDFQDKQIWFRENLDNIKIHWAQGAETINVT